MKKTIRQVLLLAIVLVFILPKSSLANDPQNATTIVFVVSYEGYKNPKRVAAAKQRNEAIKEAVKEFWEADINYKFMIEKEAYKYARKNKGVIVGEFLIKTSLRGGIGHMSSEGVFDIRDRKTKKILSVRLPADIMEKADFAYALMHGQFMLKNLHKFKKPTKELPKKYGHLLKEKTLLVSEENISKRFTKEDLLNAYPHKVKVVSADELQEAILIKDDQHLVLYEASEGGNVSSASYPYWNIYQPSDGTVIARHGGNIKGLSKADIGLFVKRTSK